MQLVLTFITILVSYSVQADQVGIVSEKGNNFVIKVEPDFSELTPRVEKNIQSKEVKIGNLTIPHKMLFAGEVEKSEVEKSTAEKRPQVENQNCKDVLHVNPLGSTLLRCLDKPVSAAFTEFMNTAEMVTIKLSAPDPDASMRELTKRLIQNKIEDADISMDSQRCNKCIPIAILTSVPFK